MKLAIQERLVFPTLFPKEGNLIEQILIKDISQKIALNQEEVTEIGLTVDDNKFSWNIEKAKDLEITLTDAELNFLKEQVKRLDSEKKINQQIIDICQKINA